MPEDDETSKLTMPKFASFKSKNEKDALKPPKFSSFKPKAKESDEVRHRDKDRDREERRKRSRHLDIHHDHHRSKRRRSTSHDEHTDSRRDDCRQRLQLVSHPKAAAQHREEERETPRLYYRDTKGDPLVIKYGTLDRSQIPAYYRDGCGRVLGTAGRLTIHRDGPRDQFSLRMPGEGPYVYRDKDGLRSKTWRVRQNPIRIRTKEAVPHDDLDGDFLPLSTSKKRKRSRDVSDSGDDQQPSYRSIEGKAKPKLDVDSDTETDSDSVEEIDLGQENPLKRTSIQLSRRVKDHPGDIDSWLQLSDHQDALLRAGEDIDHQALENEAHSYAEIKLHMLESALSNVSDPKDRERVLVPLMREGIKVWSSKTTTKRWAELLHDEGANFQLWKTHLDFSMSDIATFQFSQVQDMHLDRLTSITKRHLAKTSSEHFSEAIYVFLRLTRFIHDSGFRELSVAAWQALLELNFFRTASVDHGSWTEAFGQFWESEVPRIGELDARGFANYDGSQEVGNFEEPQKDSSPPSSESRDVYKRWASIEHHRAEKARLPAKTMDEGTDDDPFRVVMYQDISSFLFVIPSNMLPELQEQLVDAFLMFFRLPPAFRSSTWTEEVFRDQFLTGTSYVTSLQTMEKLFMAEDLLEETERKPPTFERGYGREASTLDGMFCGQDWFSYLGQKSHHDVGELSLISNVVQQLVFAGCVPRLAEYHLGLSLMKDGANTKKPAKALLKKFRTNLSLYTAYALAEFSNKNVDIATTVMTQASKLASVSRNIDPEPRERMLTLEYQIQKRPNSETFQLWRHWSWVELQLGHKQAAIWRLCSSIDDTLRTQTSSVEISSTHVLKAQQVFSSNIHQSLLTEDLDDAILYSECSALLSYLTADGATEPKSDTQGNISSAMAVIQAASLEFKLRKHERSNAHERLLQFAARLLYIHATRG